MIKSRKLSSFKGWFVRSFCLCLTFVSGLMLLACTQEDEPVAVNQQAVEIAQYGQRQTREAKALLLTKSALHDSLTMHRAELAPEVLSVWRRFASAQPSLLLLSDEPMLRPVPASLVDDVAEFVNRAGAGELARRSHPKAPDLLLFPDMTVDVALTQSWIGKLAWVLPFRNPAQELTIEPFREQLATKGLASEEEVATLHGDSERVLGRFRGVPTEIATLENLSPMAGPVIVHIDLSYFKNLYKNEIATPLLTQVFSTLAALRERELSVLAVTFSYGNLDERIALDVRFIGEVVAKLFDQPEMFMEPAPANWVRQDQVLYLDNFFKKEEVREIALAQEKDLPAAAWVKYNLFLSSAAHKEGAKALNYLSQAVKLDNAYAIEYLYLAETAYGKNRPDEAVRMLTLAKEAFPDNPEPSLRLAQLYSEFGGYETARVLVDELQALPWSMTYQAQVVEYLQNFHGYLEGQLSSDDEARPSAESAQRKDLRRMRVLHPGRLRQ